MKPIKPFFFKKEMLNEYGHLRHYVYWRIEFEINRIVSKAAAPIQTTTWQALKEIGL